MHKHATRCVVYTHHRHSLPFLFWVGEFAGFLRTKTSVNKRFQKIHTLRLAEQGIVRSILAGLDRRNPTPNYPLQAIAGAKVQQILQICKQRYKITSTEICTGRLHISPKSTTFAPRKRGAIVFPPP